MHSLFSGPAHFIGQDPTHGPCVEVLHGTDATLLVHLKIKSVDAQRVLAQVTSSPEWSAAAQSAPGHTVTRVATRRRDRSTEAS